MSDVFDFDALVGKLRKWSSPGFGLMRHAAAAIEHQAAELVRLRHADERRQEMQRRWQHAESELTKALRRIDVLENHCPYKPADSILRKLVKGGWVRKAMSINLPLDEGELAYLTGLQGENDVEARAHGSF